MGSKKAYRIAELEKATNRIVARAKEAERRQQGTIAGITDPEFRELIKKRRKKIFY